VRGDGDGLSPCGAGHLPELSELVLELVVEWAGSIVVWDLSGHGWVAHHLSSLSNDGGGSNERLLYWHCVQVDVGGKWLNSDG